MAMTPHIPLLIGETLASWLSRCAQRQMNMCLTEARDILGLTAMRFYESKDEDIARLSDLFGETPVKLEQAAFMQRPHGMLEHAGEIFLRAFTVPRALRFCPACRLEDAVGVTEQLDWLFRPNRVCAKHRIPLRRAAADDTARPMLATEFRPSSAELEAMIKSSELCALRHCRNTFPVA